MERPMGEFTVEQRIKDSMFNATSLVKQWNSIEGNPKRDLSKFWESKKVQEFLIALSEEENYNTPKQGYLKTRGKNGGTWVNPYIFIKLAMWINPKFEVQVIKFVYDQLIEQRHLAGDKYNVLTDAIVKLEGVNYSLVARGLNYIVFGRHQKGIRQTANKSQLDEIVKLQEQFAFAINMGYIRNFQQLMKELRRTWNIKYNPINK